MPRCNTNPSWGVAGFLETICEETTTGKTLHRPWHLLNNRLSFVSSNPAAIHDERPFDD